MSDHRRVHACPECWSLFSRTSSVRRHVLSAHQLGFVDGRTVMLTPVEVRNDLEALRLQQMSSRARRRHRARFADVVGPANLLPTSRLAAIRVVDPGCNTVTSVESESWMADHWGVWPSLDELWLPDRATLDGLLLAEPVEVRNRETSQTLHHVETQTSAPPTSSVAVMTERQSVGWPVELSFRAVVNYCLDHPTNSADRITAELCLPHPTITTEAQEFVRMVLGGVTSGIDALARSVSSVVSAGVEVTTEQEKRDYLSTLEALWITLGEYANRPS